MLGALFGNPLAAGDQTLCVYDPSGLLTYATASAGGTCVGKACWKATKSGFVYADRATAAGGLGKLSLKAGAAGKAKIGLKASGPNLRFPRLPATAPIHVQLRSASGGCWGSRFSTPIVDDTIQFKAKSD